MAIPSQVARTLNAIDHRRNFFARLQMGLVQGPQKHPILVPEHTAQTVAPPKLQQRPRVPVDVDKLATKLGRRPSLAEQYGLVPTPSNMPRVEISLAPKRAVAPLPSIAAAKPTTEPKPAAAPAVEKQAVPKPLTDNMEATDDPIFGNM